MTHSITEPSISLTRCKEELIQTESLLCMSIPEELLLHVFTFLGVKALCAIPLTCRMWKRLSSDNLFWKDLVRLKFSKMPSNAVAYRDFFIAQYFAVQAQKTQKRAKRFSRAGFESTAKSSCTELGLVNEQNPWGNFGTRFGWLNSMGLCKKKNSKV